jgi:dethiobiotin synthetase
VKLLFVTATNTDVGKTFTTLKLIEAFSKKGMKVGVCKPIETGVTDMAPDAQKLLEKTQEYNANFSSLKPTDIIAYTFSLPSAPFCADSKKEIKIEHIKNKIHRLQKHCDLLIVEGAGGLMVPITATYKMIDLAQELQASILLVTPSKLGCINDTLLSIEALERRNLSFDWCVNLYENQKDFEKVTQPFYDQVFPNWWSIQNGLEIFVDKQIHS